MRPARLLPSTFGIGIGTDSLALGMPPQKQVPTQRATKKKAIPSEEELREELSQYKDELNDPIDFARAKLAMGWLLDYVFASMKVYRFVVIGFPSEK